MLINLIFASANIVEQSRHHDSFGPLKKLTRTEKKRAHFTYIFYQQLPAINSIWIKLLAEIQGMQTRPFSVKRNLSSIKCPEQSATYISAYFYQKHEH